MQIISGADADSTNDSQSTLMLVLIVLVSVLIFICIIILIFGVHWYVKKKERFIAAKAIEMTVEGPSSNLVTIKSQSENDTEVESNPGTQPTNPSSSPVTPLPTTPFAERMRTIPTWKSKTSNKLSSNHHDGVFVGVLDGTAVGSCVGDAVGGEVVLYFSIKHPSMISTS